MLFNCGSKLGLFGGNSPLFAIRLCQGYGATSRVSETPRWGGGRWIAGRSKGWRRFGLRRALFYQLRVIGRWLRDCWCGKFVFFAGILSGRGGKKTVPSRFTADSGHPPSPKLPSSLKLRRTSRRDKQKGTDEHIRLRQGFSRR